MPLALEDELAVQKPAVGSDVEKVTAGQLADLTLEEGQNRKVIRKTDIINGDNRQIVLPNSGRKYFGSVISETSKSIVLTFPDVTTTANKFADAMFQLGIEISNYRTPINKTTSVKLKVVGWLSGSLIFSRPSFYSLVPQTQMYDDIQVRFGRRASTGLPCISISLVNKEASVKWNYPSGGVISVSIGKVGDDKTVLEHEAWNDGWNIEVKDDTDIVFQSEQPATLKAQEVRTDVQIALIARAGLGTLNPNPTFFLGTADYENWLNLNPDYDVVEDVVNGTAGSLHFKIKTYPPTLNSDNFYPVDLTKDYRAVISTKLNMTGPGVDPIKEYKSYAYVGVTTYDSDKQVIRPETLTKEPNSQTYLAQPLNNGDTQVVVEDASGWYRDDAGHRHSLLLHPKQPDGSYRYTGVNGRKYDNLGYSRINMYYATILNGNITTDYVDNGDGTWTVKLRSPWTLGSFAVGDAIRNSLGGGTYNYWISALSVPANQEGWFDYTSPWLNGAILDQYNPGGRFRNGTAFVTLMMLTNYKVFSRDKGSTVAWTDLGHTTDGNAGTPNIEREQWYSVVALDWRHKV